MNNKHLHTSPFFFLSNAVPAEQREQVLARGKEHMASSDSPSPRTFAAKGLEIAELKDARRDLEAKIAKMKARSPPTYSSNLESNRTVGCLAFTQKS